MTWCEYADGVDYVLGLAPARTSAEARQGERTLDSWSREPPLVAKAEWLPGAGGDPIRAIVEDHSTGGSTRARPSTKSDCARGDMENRKEQQLWLFADRTSLRADLFAWSMAPSSACHAPSTPSARG